MIKVKKNSSCSLVYNRFSIGYGCLHRFQINNQTSVGRHTSNNNEMGIYSPNSLPKTPCQASSSISHWELAAGLGTHRLRAWTGQSANRGRVYSNKSLLKQVTYVTTKQQRLVEAESIRSLQSKLMPMDFQTLCKKWNNEKEFDASDYLTPQVPTYTLHYKVWLKMPGHTSNLLRERTYIHNYCIWSLVSSSLTPLPHKWERNQSPGWQSVQMPEIISSFHLLIISFASVSKDAYVTGRQPYRQSHRNRN